MVEDAAKKTFWISVQKTIDKMDGKSQPVPPMGNDKLLALKKIIYVVVEDLKLILGILLYNILW